MEYSITKQILFEHFSGRLTALQRSRVEAWLREPANRERYYEWLEEWEHLNLQYIADRDTAFRQSLEQIEQWEQEPINPAKKIFLVRRYLPGTSRLLIAASLGLCLLLGGYASRSYWLNQTIATAYGEIRRVTLPDGSVVTLNAHSSVTFPRFGFGKRTRTVALTGEATFSVRHTKINQRFVVHTPKGLDVVVLGTEFNVYARLDDIKVVLKKGAIRLDVPSTAQTNRSLLMRPGDLVQMDKAGKLAIRHGTQPEVVTAWQDYRFIFSRTSMAEITTLVKENYNLTVTLNDSQLAERTVSGTFQARTADEFLQVIAQLLEVNYNRQENSVTFF